MKRSVVQSGEHRAIRLSPEVYFYGGASQPCTLSYHLCILKSVLFDQNILTSAGFLLSRIRYILKIWPLPSVNDRRKGLVPIKWVHRELRLERDADYLCYRAFCIGLYVNTFLILFMYADYFLHLDIIVPQTLISRDKLGLDLVLQHLLLTPTLACMLLFYARQRLAMDLKNDSVPITIKRSSIEKSPRKAWIRWSLFGVMICLFIPFLAHIPVDRFVRHFHGENSLPVILVMQIIFQVVGCAFASGGFIASALLLEKSIRFFPEAKLDLQSRATIKC